MNLVLVSTILKSMGVEAPSATVISDTPVFLHVYFNRCCLFSFPKYKDETLCAWDFLLSRLI